MRHNITSAASAPGSPPPSPTSSPAQCSACSVILGNPSASWRWWGDCTANCPSSFFYTAILIMLAPRALTTNNSSISPNHLVNINSSYHWGALGLVFPALLPPAHVLPYYVLNLLLLLFCGVRRVKKLPPLLLRLLRVVHLAVALYISALLWVVRSRVMP